MIDGTLHPLRWIAIAAVTIPCALAAGFLLTKLTGHSDAARSLLRSFRCLLIFEAVLLVILAAVGFLYESHARSLDRQLYHPPGKLIDVGGYRLHLKCEGSGGPTVVLEYGLQATYFDWLLVEPEIARFARVCYYDRGGYGWSDPSPRPRVPSVMVEELHTLLHNAGEAPPYILAAHSFGSFNAVMFAHKFPDEVAGLVLIDGLHTMSTFPFTFSDKLSIRGMQFMIPFGIPRWRGWCGGAGPEAIRGERQAISCRSSLYTAFYREGEALPESVMEMRNIRDVGTIPLIVIAKDPKLNNLTGDAASGGDDWEAIQRQKLALSKNVELVIATGSGHNVPQARPDVIIAAVKKLVDQTRSGAGSTNQRVTKSP